ncbi:MAG: hypothetical protein ACKO38_08690 [Planctomycetota bacterium]
MPMISTLSIAEICRHFRRPTMLVGAAALSLFVLLLTDGKRSVRADSWRDETFLAGLRARRLFELAEAHCERRSADRSLTTVERGQLTVDWIRCLAEHARHSPTAQREKLLERAHEVASQFTAAFPEHSLGFLVRTQEAIVDATAGELARLEAEASPDPAVERAAARKRCRAASTRLEQLDRQLAEFLPQRFRRGAIPDELAVEQLASLQHQIRLQAARAHRGLALAYDESSDDWLAALGRGLQLLEPSLRQLTPEMPLYAPLTLEAATQLRLLGRVDAAHAMLARLAPEPPQPRPTLTRSLQWAMLAEQLRSAVGQRRWSEAEQLTARQPPTSTGLPAVDGSYNSDEGDAAKADWDFARFETLIARWRDAGMATTETGPARGDTGVIDIGVLKQRSLALLDQIEAEHGPYWKHRGDLLLVSVGAATGTRDADLLGRSADSLVAQDRVDEALRTYEQAAGLAAREQNREAAFQWAYKAGLLQQRRQRFDDAAERLRVAAVDHPDHPQAPLAHLAALWNLAQSVRQKPPVATNSAVGGPPVAETKLSQALETYGQWLEDHVRRWPMSPTTCDAQVWRGAWLESRGAWSEASAAYRALPETHAAALDAYRGVLRTETRRLAAAVAPSGEVAQPPAASTNSAVVGAEVEAWLMRPVPEAISSQLTVDDRQASAQLLFLSLWTQAGREADARKALAAVTWPLNDQSRTTAREWLVLTQRQRATSSTVRRQSLAPLSLELAEIAAKLRVVPQPSGATPATAPTKDSATVITDGLLAMVRAEALEDLGKQSEAIALRRQLAATNPSSGAAQQSLAEALERSEKREDWRGALDQWRRIAAKSPPHSQRWFQAKLGTVRQLVRLDQRAEAEKLVRFLLESPPPTPDEWRRRLEAAVATPMRE